jgi:Na+/H+ antiporter NhaC
MVNIITKAGGNKGIAEIVTRLAKTARSTRIATALMGLAIFFDDYANTVVVGITFRPLTDKFRICREKLAYLVDSTAAPIAGLSIISTWIGYEVGLFEELSGQLNLGVSGYEVFFRIIPFRFYCMFTICFVFLSCFLCRDFGPMFRAEQRSLSGQGVLRQGARLLTSKALTRVSPKQGIIPKWYVAVIPVLIVIFSVIVGMVITGGRAEEVRVWRQGKDLGEILSLSYIRMCFTKGDNGLVLMCSSLIGSLVAFLFAITRRYKENNQRAIGLREAFLAWISGCRAMLYAICILILAWSIRQICEDLGTSQYLISVIQRFMQKELLPLFTFFLAALVAFSTGTSWGTMGILLPTVMPVGYAMGGWPLLILVSGAVLDGAIFGDHCSPISDTTVMSSVACFCDHIDHVRTQLPYAVVTMSVAGLCGYIPAALEVPWGLNIILGVLILGAILLIFGKKPNLS